MKGNAGNGSQASGRGGEAWDSGGKSSAGGHLFHKDVEPHGFQREASLMPAAVEHTGVGARREFDFLAFFREIELVTDRIVFIDDRDF